MKCLHYFNVTQMTKHELQRSNKIPGVLVLLIFSILCEAG